VEKRKKASSSGQWKSIERLERRIEGTVCDDLRPGFIENMYGSFDREDLTSELLAVYEQLRERDPTDVYLTYRYAGALMRASKFDDARTMYTSIVESNTSALLMLAMLELKCGNKPGAEARLGEYNQRCIAEGMPFMQSNLAKIELPPAAHAHNPGHS
jgi:hypothetical protein